MMKRTGPKTSQAALFIVSLLVPASFPAFAADDVGPAIEAASKKWEAAANRSDGPGVAALYTADGQLLPAQSDFVSGT